MTTTKLSISFDRELEEAIRLSALKEDRSLSSWIAEAATQRLRTLALADALQAWEQENGALTRDEIERANRVFDRAARKNARPSRKNSSAA
jgi:hypothetical protein